jgi:hypothetical protein
MFLGQSAKFIVFDSHLFCEGVLVLLTHFHFHNVATVHPRGKGPLFHPVVHLAKQDLLVPLGCHILFIEPSYCIKALSHKTMVKCRSQLFTATLISILNPSSLAVSFPSHKSFTAESIPHLLQE